MDIIDWQRENLAVFSMLYIKIHYTSLPEWIFSLLLISMFFLKLCKCKSNIDDQIPLVLSTYTQTDNHDAVTGG